MENFKDLKETVLALEEDAIKFYCDSQNRHGGTAWELYKIDGYYNDQTNDIEATA
jgi:hypothetical protein